MSEEKEKSIDLEIYKKYGKHFVDKTSLASILALAVILCLIGGFFLPFTLYFSIPLIALPLLLGFIFINLSFDFVKESPGKIFVGFKMFYDRPFFGVFRIILGTIISIATYIISSTLLLTILHFTVGLNDPSYAYIMDQAMNASNNQELQKYLVDLQENSTFIFIENITAIVSIGLAAYIYVHHIIFNSFKIFMNFLHHRFISGVGLNLIHRHAIKEFRFDFYRDYYSTFWYIALLFIGGYVGGSLFGLNILHLTGAKSAIVGLFTSLILTIYFLPFVYDMLSIIFTVDSHYYYKAIIKLNNAGINPTGGAMSQAEIDKINEGVAKAEEMIEQFKKEEKEKKAQKKANKKSKDKK